MFDDHNEPKDMFASIPEKTPSMPSPTLSPQFTEQQPVAQDTFTVSPDPSAKKHIFSVIGMMTIALVCLGGAGYAAYRAMTATPSEEQVILEQDTEAQDTQKTTEKKSTVNDTEKNATDGTVAVVDSDGDGLSNEEERTLGTSVAKADSDGDGLGDREEVKVYETDPLRADTDGDTYKDGEEVRNGYNPNGNGKLLQLPR